jgi:hypothetical protein
VRATPGRRADGLLRQIAGDATQTEEANRGGTSARTLEQRKPPAQKSTRTRLKLHDSVPKFAQLKFTWLQTDSPQKLLLEIAPNPRKLRLKPTTKIEKNTEQKSYKNMMNFRGHEEDSDLLSHSKSQEIYHEILRFLTSIKKH